MSSRLTIAVGCGCCLLLVAGAVAQTERTAMLELTSFQEGDSRDYLLGDGTLHIERRGAAVRVSHALPGALPRPLLDCVIAESHCSIRIEEIGERTRVHWLRYQSEAQEELVLEERAGRLALVAGMVATSRIGTGRRSGLREEPSRAETASAAPAASSSEVLLRCPEEDSWMKVPAAEAEGGYYCQRHGYQLEVAGGATSASRWR